MSKPTISPNGGEFSAPVPVTLAHADPRAKLFYTLDGTRPGRRKTPYVGPFMLESSAVLRVKAFTDTDRSDPARATFTIVIVEPGETFITVPDTIPSDDSDQSAALQKFFDEAGDGVSIYVPRLFRFDSAGPRLVNRKGVRIFGEGGFTTPTDGYDVTPTPGHEHQWPRTRDRFKLLGCDNIVLENLILEGSNQQNRELRGYVETLEGQHGVDCSGSRDVKLLGLTVRYVRGDWLYFGGGKMQDGSRRWSENVLVRGGDLSYNGRQGFGITGVRGLTIEDTKTHYCRRTTVDFEPNGPNGGAVGVTFRRCDFGLGHLTWLTIHRKGTIEDVLFEDNVVDKPNLVMPYNLGSRVKNLRLLRNVGTSPVGNPQGAAWKIEGVDGFDARGNSIRVQGSRGMYVMQLLDCTGVMDPAAIEAENEAIGGPDNPALGIIHPDSEYE